MVIEVTLLRSPKPVSQDRVFVSVEENIGGRFSVQDSIEAVIDTIKSKAGKVPAGEDRDRHGNWWLVIDGERLVMRGHPFFGEMREIASAIEECRWDRVVVMSRYLGGWHHVLWEA